MGVKISSRSRLATLASALAAVALTTSAPGAAAAAISISGLTQPTGWTLDPKTGRIYISEKVRVCDCEM
jgi:nicotinamide mononucleotide (NMN) deamidase PncC